MKKSHILHSGLGPWCDAYLRRRVFPMIERSHSALAGKITGMLLEMETPDLLQLLESPEALSEKTAEAIQVLESASTATDGSQ